MYNFNHVYFAPLFIKVEDKSRPSYSARDPSPARQTEPHEQDRGRAESKAADDIDWKNDEAYRGKTAQRDSPNSHDPEDKQMHLSSEMKRDQSDNDLEEVKE